MKGKRLRLLKFLAFIIVVLFNLLIIRADATDGTVVVIVNKDNPVEKLNENDIKRMYINYILNWPNGEPIILYDLAIQNPLRFIFSEKIFGKSPDRIADDWAHLKITNQAKNPPLIMKSETLIIRKVSMEKGAIGYVSLRAVKDNQDVKIVSSLHPQ